MYLAVVLTGWTLFLFAHSYRATVVPLVCGVALLGVVSPPVLFRSPARLVDGALALSLAAIALQLLPLPASLRGSLSPATAAYDRAMLLEPAGDGVRPLSVDPRSTLFALVVVVAIVVLFWSLRTLAGRRGRRILVRAITWFGLLVSPLAIVHHVMPLPLIETFWSVTPRGLRPYGPFVNRNDFAGWLVMALPLALGYMLARIDRRRQAALFDRDAAPDSTSIWLGLALSSMLAGLLFSLSRSGLLGAACGLLFFAWIARHHLTAPRAFWSLAALGSALAVATLFADVDALSVRLGASVSEGLDGRLSIWRQTMPMIRDFWFAGSGAGTYQTVMVLYQTMSRLFYISHADNELVQIAAEGGVLLTVPVVCALAAGAALIARRLRDDRTSAFWLRAGAAAGLLSVFVQNMVEMTVRVPANAVLMAVLAAVAMHDPQAPGERQDGLHGSGTDAKISSVP